jgi:Xaa-Pro aminopeptidase
MDPAYISALAALAGSIIGGLMSLATSWLTQHAQFRTQQLARDVTGREELYKDFIEEASKLYADAYEHNQAEISKFVRLYALISRMRILSSPEIIEKADRVGQAIIETYLAPNRTFHDLMEILDNDTLNPLREFSNVCREELRRRGSS